MPRLDYQRCRNCGRFAKDVGAMSHTCLCPECGPRIHAETVTQLVAHDGPRFKDWRRGMAASVGAVLVDDVLTTS